MVKTKAKSSGGGAAETAAADIQKLREAVVERSDLLLTDLSLPALGLPEQSVRSRLQDRGKRWDRSVPAGSKLADLKSILRNKSTSKRFAVARGCRVPEVYWFGNATEPPDFANFPPNFVLKPNHSHSSQGVVVYKNGTNLMDGSRVSLADLPGLMASVAPSIGLRADAEWLVEELIADIDPRYAIPRDFKFHVAGGRAHFLYVVNRNAVRDHWCTCWYTRSWSRINDRMGYGRLFGPDMEKPVGFDALLSAVDRLALALGIFMRIDFYLTANGPVLGEFTPFADHGLYYSEMCELALSQMWGLFPDPEGV